MSRTPLVLLVLLAVGRATAKIDQTAGSAQSLDGVAAEPTPSRSRPDDGWRKDCAKSYGATCLKLDLVSFVDRISEREDIGLFPGVSVIRQNGLATAPAPEVVADLARDFPKDVDRRVDAYLIHKIGAYLNSHAISIKLFDPKTFEAARSFNEAALEQLGLGKQEQNVAESARKKDKGGMNGMMAALMMMKGTLGALGFGALAMLAGKALMTGLMALMLSTIVGLKHLSSGAEKKTTYEIVSKPVYTSTHSHSAEEHHGGYGGGFGRSIDVAAEAVQDALKKYGNVRDRRAAAP